jgi:hypothetical protein
VVAIQDEAVFHRVSVASDDVVRAAVYKCISSATKINGTEAVGRYDVVRGKC